MLTLDSSANGKPHTWSHMDGFRIVRIDIDTDEDGTVDRSEYYDACASDSVRKDRSTRTRFKFPAELLMDCRAQ